MIFGNGKESVSGSASFVEIYWLSFGSCNSTAVLGASNKGKEVMSRTRPVNFASPDHEKWLPPPSDCIKINVDTSFVESISAASAGLLLEILRVRLLYLQGISLGVAPVWMKQSCVCA